MHLLLVSPPRVGSVQVPADVLGYSPVAHPRNYVPDEDNDRRLVILPVDQILPVYIDADMEPGAFDLILLRALNLRIEGQTSRQSGPSVGRLIADLYVNILPRIVLRQLVRRPPKILHAFAELVDTLPRRTIS